MISARRSLDHVLPRSKAAHCTPLGAAALVRNSNQHLLKSCIQFFLVGFVFVCICYFTQINAQQVYPQSNQPVTLPSGTAVVLNENIANTNANSESGNSNWGRIPQPTLSGLTQLLPSYTPAGTPANVAQINLPGFEGNQPSVFDTVPSYTPLMGDNGSTLNTSGASSGGQLPSSVVGGAAGDFSLKAEQVRLMRSDDFVADVSSGGSRFLFSSKIVKEPITILGTRGIETVVDGETVYIIENECRIRQGQDQLTASRAVIWEKRPKFPNTGAVRQLIVYLESGPGEPPPTIDINSGSASGTSNDHSWIGGISTRSEVTVMLNERVGQISRLPDLYYRAATARRPGTVTPRSFQRLASSTSSVFTSDATVAADNGEMGVLGFSYGSRGETPVSARLLHFPETNQSKIIIEQGVNFIISGVRQNNYMTGNTIDISADRAVGWTVYLQNLIEHSQSSGERVTINDLDLELYLEGNIVFREGERIIYADRMYYDVKNSVAKILDAEMRTPVEQYDGEIRIKADSIQQTGPGSLSANNAIMTTSPMGDPSFFVGAKNIQFEEKRNTGYSTFGGAYEDRRQYVISEHNVVNVGGVPVFYWPWLALNAKEPIMYLRKAEYYHDDVFGHQARTRWNLYQMLNIRNYPDGTVLDLNVDYLSKRGLGHGVQFTYNRDSVCNMSTPAVGLADFWGIYDKGEDNLGLERRNLEPEKDYRYRGFWRHRQFFDGEPFGPLFRDGWQLTAELGISSDRNFLPQFFEKEWETLKDETTAIEMKRTSGSQSLGIRAEYTVEDFYNQNGSLPRLDHFTLGYSPFSKYFGDRFTWYEHTHIGLRAFETLSTPKDASDLAMFRHLDWEVAPGSSLSPYGPVDSIKATREVFSTKHEIDMPFSLGPVKCVPYLMGEFAHWGEDRNGDSVDRLMGAAGFRANLPFWKVNPNYSSRTLYVNGLAHKANLGFDFSYATVNEGYDDMILYDSIDDRSIQDYRRRYSVTTFNGAVPLLYDERYYAIRSGLGNWVTSPSTELVDDLTLCRFHFNQTWQTKRGPTNRRRIIDWITLDTGLNFYPKEEQNFGEKIGLMDYDFRWHVGDRFTVMSSGLFDTFNSGQTIVRFGGMLHRPDRGSVYLGVDRLDGPFTRTYLNGSVAYHLSEKWSADYSTSYDLDNRRSMGQSLSLSRRGEVFLVKVGANYDWSRDVWGVSFSLEPAFLSKMRSSKSFSSL